jgi:hypothetical protein
MTPEPTDKLVAATQVVVNGPEDDLLDGEWIVGPQATGPRGLARAGCRETGKSGSSGPGPAMAWPTRHMPSRCTRRRRPVCRSLARTRCASALTPGPRVRVAAAPHEPSGWGECGREDLVCR